MDDVIMCVSFCLVELRYILCVSEIVLPVKLTMT